MHGRARRIRRHRLTRSAGLAGIACLSFVLSACAAAPGTTTPAAQRQNTAPAVMSPAASSGDDGPFPAAASPAAASATAQGQAAPGAAPSSPPPGPSSAAADILAAAQLPAAQAEKWKAAGPASTRDIAGQGISENECAKIVGATTWTQQGFSGGDGQNEATQDTFTFASAAAAQDAYTAFVTGMGACQAASRADQSTNHVRPDAVVRPTGTATAAHALAWERTWTGVMGISAAGPQINHAYVAIGGTCLIVLQFTELPGDAAPYAVSGDPGVLAMLAGELTR